MRISDWSSDVCSSDLPGRPGLFLDVLDTARIEGEIERTVKARATAAIISRGVRSGPESFQIFLVGPRVIIEQDRRKRAGEAGNPAFGDRKSTRLNSRH